MANRIKDVVDGIKMKEDMKDEILSDLNSKSDNRKFRNMPNKKLYDKGNERTTVSASRRRLPFTATAVIILIAIISTSVLAVSLGGGEFFREMFINLTELNKGVYDYMDTDQLSAISGNTIGTVIDTNELKIEVMDTISSGNMAMVMLRVTAKELESVLFDTGYETLMNYRFGDDSYGSLFEDMDQTSIRYYYSDNENTLAKNQFMVLYTITNHHTFEAGTYLIELNDFGYYINKDEGLVLNPLYNRKWKFEVELANGHEYSHAALVGGFITAGEYKFILEDIRITPMSSTMVFSYESKDESSDIYNAFVSNTDTLKIILTDGTVLSKEDFSYTISSGSDGTGNSISAIVINITFNVPINAKSVREFIIFEETFSIPNKEFLQFP